MKEQTQELLSQVRDKKDFTYPVGLKRYAVELRLVHASPSPSITFEDADIVMSQVINNLRLNEWVYARKNGAMYFISHVTAFDNKEDAEEFAKAFNRTVIDTRLE
jgi:hypothetical protein